MTTGRHGDTETRARGIDAILENAFERMRLHFREIGLVVAGLLVVGLAAAGFYELGKRRENAAQAVLAEIQIDMIKQMGGEVRIAINPEPANAEQSRRAREAALERLDLLIEEEAESEAAILAGIHAGEVEVDLGSYDAASARLGALASGLDADDPRRAIALRLRGYALERLGDPVAAGEAYYEAAGVETYPPRAQVYITAGEVFARGGAHERAIAALQQAMALAPAIAENSGLLSRIAELEAHRVRDLGLDPGPDLGAGPTPEAVRELDPDPAALEVPAVEGPE